MSHQIFSVHIIPIVFTETNEQKFLLQLSDINPGISTPGQWAILGGRSLSGESPVKAAIRELFEETEIVAKTHQLRLLHVGKLSCENGDRPVYFFMLNFMTAPRFRCREGRQMKLLAYSDLLKLHIPPKHLSFVLKAGKRSQRFLCR